MRVETQGTREWLATLKQLWDVDSTTLISDEDCFVVMHFSKNRNVHVAYFDRATGRGYISDRRKEVR